MGSFVLVLHGHMPWVLNHGRWPHGEHWLYEAAVGVYLPLLSVLDELHLAGVEAPLTLGLTPVLLEQLAHDRFKLGLKNYLEERLERANHDQKNPNLAAGAAFWKKIFSDRKEQLAALDGDLVGAFSRHARAGRVELLSSFATHGYAPLLLHDQSIRAQLRVGLETSERHLGFRPKGIWLPECAFRPTGPWTPPEVHGDERNRRGVDRILEEEGVSHFFVDAHTFDGARSEGVIESGFFRKVGWDAVDVQHHRGWRSPLEPHCVSTTGEPSCVTAMARHPRVSEQVWSAEVGYPGDGAYLEFHKKQDGDGLRYWRVTHRGSDLGEKHPYDPSAVASVVHRQAQHFVGEVREALHSHREKTGRDGVVVATFDAELFGHWWFEGPQFVRELLLALHHDPSIQVQTAQGHLQSSPPDKVAWLPEGSWGEEGDHRVWLNDTSRWIWAALYRAEDRFFTLLWKLGQAGPERADKVQPMMVRLGRELLLLQASDWPFVIHTKGAVDYGFRRLSGHMTRFENLANLCQDLLNGGTMSELQCLHVAEADGHDDVFLPLSLDAWRS